jgi:peptidoglycan/LPS O-acetylase OafA/YrhL
LFFILSGFVICKSLHEKKEGHLLIFIQNRVARILPPLIGAIVLTFILYLALVYLFSIKNLNSIGDLYYVRPELEIKFSTWINALLLVPDSGLTVNGPIWTIGYEWWCYMLILVIVFFKLKKQYGLMIFITASLLLVLYNSYSGIIVFFLTFLMGGGWFIIFTRFSNRATLVTGLIVGVFSCWALSFYDFMSCIFSLDSFYNIYINSFQLLFSLVIVSGLMILSFLRKSTFFSFVFSRIAKHAKYSYSLYLIHFPILVIIAVIFDKFSSISNVNRILVLIPIMIMILALSYIFSLFFERKKYFHELFFGNKPCDKN